MGKLKMPAKQGQVFTTDVMFSTVLFVIIIIFLLSLWNIYSQQLQEQQVTEEMELLSFQIIDLLVSSPGFPNNWEELASPGGNSSAGNSSEIMTLGLIRKDRELSPRKIAAFFGLDYGILKQLLNVERYELQVNLLELNGTAIKTIGIAPTNSSDRSVSLQRIVLDGSKARKISMTLWSETS